MTRNHLDILKEIDELLKINGFEGERLEIIKQAGLSSTGSELCLLVGSALLTLQKKNKAIERIIGQQVAEFVDYCRSSGLFPAPR